MAAFLPMACAANSCVRISLLTFVLALALGCVNPAPLPTAPFLARQLDVAIDPKESANYLLNPSPLGKGGYPQGMVVTIDILPQQGWRVDKWVGPVYKIDGTTAQIQMDSSQTVAVRLIPTTPPTVTSTPVLTGTARSTPTTSAYSYFDEGKEYAEANNWSMAIEQFTRAIQLDSDYAIAYHWRGYAYNGLGEYKNAIADNTKAIQLDSGYSVAYNNRGFAYKELGQYQNAVIDLNTAIRIDPYDAVAYNNRRFAHRGLGQFTLAAADKIKACSLDSKYC